ncbi:MULTISPECIES: hypothetical protein [unclassified Pseudoxanthomonas]|uniref:hypothetical protein n=1 Tax=unclassified Pseudoxanthomonas TaxID=2645906 RepID=UPI00161E5F3E|nr:MULTISPECIES: hypothetical protein [unclassified Pseudoxanthomonas]MBB3278092.1 hypothetical protein [Pseudoxanthomonas sp. OG2]MBV7475928.1 hypothetical protein [Pseudoxanthomonas sp. PXM05]
MRAEINQTTGQKQRFFKSIGVMRRSLLSEAVESDCRAQSGVAGFGGCISKREPTFAK